ncbi:hypothetical protein GEV33_009179 [Tenebrio molitor]|uniref:Uncharacterized protein n=1 Tax=Tenebrio molitor TaxID=7067 RepID=A0A8J6HFU4_TENMO|nr:hypothetical protein GEV33_009179 [Tenebrio molitor]
MDVEINPDLCAIESRDELPDPETLKVKIIQENDARKNCMRSVPENAMFSSWYRQNKPNWKQSEKELLQTKMESSNFVVTNSGATSHLSNEPRDFSNKKKVSNVNLNLANDQSTKIVGAGVASFTADVFGDVKNVTLDNTLHVPDLRTKLLSVSKIADKGCEILFKKNHALVFGADGNVKLIGDRVGYLYFARVPRNSAFTSRHVNYRDLVKAVANGFIEGVEALNSTNRNTTCEVWCKRKMTRTSFPKSSDRKTNSLDIIHTVLCGPFRTESNGKAKYFVEFIDDQSRWCDVRFLKSKTEVVERTFEVMNLMENQKGRTVKCIQSDNVRSPIIFLGRSCKYSELPEESMSVQKFKWKHPIRDVDRYGFLEKYAAHNSRRPPGKGKLTCRSKEGILVGYSEESKAYRIWIPEESKVEISRDVKFMELNERVEENETDVLLEEEPEITGPRTIDVDVHPMLQQNVSQELEVERDDEVADEEGEVVRDEENVAQEQQRSRRGPAVRNIARLRCCSVGLDSLVLLPTRRVDAMTALSMADFSRPE